MPLDIFAVAPDPPSGGWRCLPSSEVIAIFGDRRRSSARDSRRFVREIFSRTFLQIFETESAGECRATTVLLRFWDVAQKFLIKHWTREAVNLKYYYMNNYSFKYNWHQATFSREFAIFLNIFFLRMLIISRFEISNLDETEIANYGAYFESAFCFCNLFR